MNKVICDCCGKEIAEQEGDETPGGIKISIQRVGSGRSRFEFDLHTKDCLDKFNQYIKKFGKK